jgi:glutamate synthase domain-containing protein 3
MSGGIAYVLDDGNTFARRCNHELVDLEGLDWIEDEPFVRTLLERHADLTGSTVAAALLASWPRTAARFVKVMPRDYRRALQADRAAAVAVTPRRAAVQVAHG